MIRTFFVFILTICCLSCATNTRKKVLHGQAFGTTYTIQYYGDREAAYMHLGIDSIVNVVNQSMSTYIPQSDISKINAGDSTIAVDKLFREVFTLSRKLNQRSKGYFDPTVGVLRNAYGFGDTQAIKHIDSTRLDSIMRYVGWDKVQLQVDGTIKKEYPEIYFDFNAIAKGYGIDRIAAYFNTNLLENYLIELGGEVVAKGKNLTKDQPWVVGIEAINSAITERTYEATLALENRAMAASGNYRKTRLDTLTGKRYVHTINPLTGSAEKSDVLSATVLAPNCALADGWATAFMAMGYDNALQALKSNPVIEAYLVYGDSLGQQQVFTTAGFKAVLRD